MYKPLSLEGKVAVVVGGTSGLGRAMAVGLAAAGADVVPCSRRLDAADPVALEIEQQGRRALRLAVDVASRESLVEVRDTVLEAFGHVDILINSAGRIRRTAALELSEEEWACILETNLTGTLRACQVFAPTMIAQSWGRIVNIASGVFRTTLNESLLDGTERGRELLLRTPAGRFGRVEELAGAAVFLSSEAASFVNGQILVVDGGFLASGVNQ